MKKLMIYFILFSAFFTIYSQNESVMLVEKGDLLKISTTNIQEYNFLKYVDNNGYIDLPYIRTIKVEGLSLEEIAGIIKNKLNDGYFRDPEVTVSIEKSVEKKIYVFGMVRNAGEYLYSKDMRVLELISKAGGYIGDTKGLTVKIFRNNEKVAIFSLSKLIDHNLINYNVKILPGDILVILSEVENE